MQASRKNISY